MTRIKLCGISRCCDIETVNMLMPEYIGFVFTHASRRFVTPEKAGELKRLLSPEIKAVGVFTDESPDIVAGLLNDDTIDIAQLHGNEDKNYVDQLKKLTGKPLIKAFRINNSASMADIETCSTDYILLDSGAGTGTAFDWKLIQNIKRPYFLAGGLSPENAADAVAALRPFAVDVSSGIETAGVKDMTKMTAFVNAVRKADGRI